MKHGMLLLLILASIRVPAAPAACKYLKAIEAPAPAVPQLLAVPLDSEVYEASRDDYADVRVIDAADREVPRAIRSQWRNVPGQGRAPVAARPPRLEPPAADSLRIEIELAQAAPSAEGLSLSIPGRNFAHQVRVEGSRDGRSWVVLVPQAAIYDYSQYLDVRQTEIALPANDSRRFRLTISQPDQEMIGAIRNLQKRHGADGTLRETVADLTIQTRPLRIDRIEFWRTAAAAVPELRDYELAEWAVEEDADGKRTIVLVRTRGEPLEELHLQVPERNFRRNVRIETPEGRHLQATTIHRMDLPGLQRESLRLPAPDRRREFRLVIEHGDSPPLTVTGIRARGRVERVLLIAEPDTEYRLVYGWENAPAPRYDLPDLLAALQQEVEPLAGILGPQQANPLHDATVARPPLLARRGFLIAALVLMLAVLAFALVHAGRTLPADTDRE